MGVRVPASHAPVAMLIVARLPLPLGAWPTPNHHTSGQRGKCRHKG